MVKNKYGKNRICKSCVALLFSIAIFLSLAESVEARSIHLIINGSEVEFLEEDGYGVPFIDSANRTQVPVRKPLEQIGATVHFDEASRTVQIQKDNTAIALVIGGLMYVNGSEYPIDSPATIVNSRTYLPIRAVFTALGYDVDWEQEYYTIDVNSKDNLNKGWSIPMLRLQPVPHLYEDVGLVFSYYGGIVSLSDPHEYNGMKILGIELKNSAGMSLHNQSDKTVIISPLDFRIQLTKDGVVVFDKACPSFSIEIPANSGISRDIPVNYWERQGISIGNYEIKLIFPEKFVYQFKGESELRYLDFKDNMWNEVYEFSVVN